mgnify:CR=1 FL=1
MSNIQNYIEQEGYKRIYKMQFDASKSSERTVFEKDGLRARKQNDAGYDISQGDLNLRNGKYIIELKYGT